MVRNGRRGGGAAWARMALRVAGRQFRAHLVRVGLAAKVGVPTRTPHAPAHNATLPSHQASAGMSSLQFSCSI